MIVSSPRASRLAVFAAFAGALFAASCSKEATPSAEQPKPPAATAKPAETAETGDKSGAEPAKEGTEPAAEGSPDVKDAKASYSEANFTLNMKVAGEYKAGKEAKVEIVLEAIKPFHANDKYPYKFKTAESAGVTYPDAVVKKEQATVEAMKVTMPVAFTAAAAGKKKVNGVFHFSVCTEDKCMIEKRALALEVDVK